MTKGSSGRPPDGRGEAMGLDITKPEEHLLLELIEAEEVTAIEGIAHADSRTFKTMLRKRLELLASIKQKIRTFDARAA
jgi:hypothetical protein